MNPNSSFSNVLLFLIFGLFIGSLISAVVLASQVISEIHATSNDHKAQLNRVIELLEKKP